MWSTVGPGDCNLVFSCIKSQFQPKSSVRMSPLKSLSDCTYMGREDRGQGQPWPRERPSSVLSHQLLVMCLPTSKGREEEEGRISKQKVNSRTFIGKRANNLFGNYSRQEQRIIAHKHSNKIQGMIYGRSQSPVCFYRQQWLNGKGHNPRN